MLYGASLGHDSCALLVQKGDVMGEIRTPIDWTRAESVNHSAIEA